MSGPDFSRFKFTGFGGTAPGKALPPSWMVAPELPVLELREERAAYHCRPLGGDTMSGRMKAEDSF